MAPLRVPGDGLLLSGSPGENESFPSQAFAITLSDDVIGDLVRCAQNGGDIELSLGSSPVSLCPFRSLSFALQSRNECVEEFCISSGAFSGFPWSMSTMTRALSVPAFLFPLPHRGFPPSF